MWLNIASVLLLVLGSLRQITGSCPDLSVPSYGVLNFNGSDVTQSQPGSYPENSTVEYACATGYRLINAATGAEQALTSTTCLVNGTWTLEGVACLIHDCRSPPVVSNANSSSASTSFGSVVSYVCSSGYRLSSAVDDGAVCTLSGWINVPTCNVIPVLTTEEILIIVVVGVGAIGVLLLFSCLFFCCYACRLRRKFYGDDLAEDQIALARAQGAFTLSNPLTVGVKDEDSAGDPLYLTPDEMDEFEKQRQ